MLKVSEFLDKSKVCAGIESDYRLAKVIGITHGAITNYRTDRTLPDERVIQKLCEFTGDDPDVISALLQSRRARTPEGKELWLRVAKRLATAAAAGVVTASVLASPTLPYYQPGDDAHCILCKVGSFSRQERLRRSAHRRKTVLHRSC